jgi:predicted alpha/beta-hydrolase family hydrolase
MEHGFTAAGTRLDAQLSRPDGAEALFLFAHGAGAGMRHPFMEAVARALFELGVATLRFQFPYMQAGKKRPDSTAKLEETARAAIAYARELAPELELYVGGKSMGGRISSQTVAQDGAGEIRGLIFVGFPLHAPNKPSSHRAEHLGAITCPMLFLQGTRDALARLELIEGVCAGLPRTTLHVVDGGDHSFSVPKRSGRTESEVIAELAQATAAFIEL